MENLLESILVGVVVLALIALAVYAFKWCVEDAERRGKSGLLVFLAVFFFFPWGLIAWLIFRPDPVEPRRPFDRRRQLT